MCVGFMGIFLESEEVRAVGPTEVSGIISMDTIWTLTNSPYIVTGHVLIDENINLTIEPGVIVKFDPDKYLKIEGILYSVGTKSQMITFTSNKSSPVPGDWQELRFTKNSKNSIIKYCVIEYGNRAIEGKSTTLTIENNIIVNNQNLIDLENGNYIFTNNELKNSSGIHLHSCHVIISNNIFLKNNAYGIWVSGCSGKIYNNNINDCRRGINCYANNVEIFNNIIKYNNEGIIIDHDYSYIHNNLIIHNYNYGIDFHNCYSSGNFGYISYNNITNNAVGLHFYKDSLCSYIIKYNNILLNKNYSVYYNVIEDIKLTTNWWGTTNTDSINQTIYDYYDDFELGKVIYKPFLTSPVDISFQPPPENKSNQPPVANAGPDQNVIINQTVNIDGSGSYDPDGDTLFFYWEFGDGKESNKWQNLSKISHSYNKFGKFTVLLNVSDGLSWDWDTCIIRVGEQQNTSSIKIISSNIQNNSQNVSINNSKIKITFSQSMDRSSVEAALKISPFANYTLYWGKDDTELLIIFDEKLSPSTTYEITLDTTAKDRNGNNLNDPFKLVFSTEKETKPADNGKVDLGNLGFYGVIISVIMIIIILAFVITNRRRLKEKHASERRPFDDRQKSSGDINIEEYSVDDRALNESDKLVDKLVKEALSVKKPSDFNFTEEEMLNQAKIKYSKGEISKTTYIVVERKLTK